MNASQLHERLRVEIVRRIDRGMLTGMLLAKQAGVQPSHISNFLHRKRQLSLSTMDRVLAAQSISVEDLLPTEKLRGKATDTETKTPLPTTVPLVSGTTAIYSPSIPANAVLEMIHLPHGSLEELRPRRTVSRRDWQRFLALRTTAEQAAPMIPILRSRSITVVDRHYNSFAPYRAPAPNLYAVNAGGAVLFRYVTFDADSLILRPHNLEYAVDLLRMNTGDSPSEFLIGRVCMTLVEP
ncbi:hypothetical protein [Silvibacterium acidisoli]|uniref:hypothetical protein n=1 Tax=Acidobacteriaceae bacterium ZG23-2 TaxID=2883246 RepID=UPI00406CEDFB